MIDNDQIEIEQAVLHAALNKPNAIALIASAAVPQDFTHPVHQRVAEHLIESSRAGRQPSIAAIMAMFGDDEIEPGLTAKKYAGHLFVGGTSMLFSAPTRDLIETWKDRLARRRIHDIGGHLQAVAASVFPVRDILDEAMSGLNDVRSSTRQGESHSYDGQGAAEAAFEHMLGEAAPIISTGLADLDEITGGWPRSELSIVAGRPGMGKSAFTVSSLLRSARAGHASVFFSLEMTRKQLGARMLTDLAYVASDRICYEDILKQRVQSQRLIDRLKASGKHLSELDVFIEEQRGVTVSQIIAKAQARANELARAGKRLDVVYVDHIGLVKPSSRYAGNRHREIAETTDALAGMAKELGCAVVGLCQLNRGVEGRESKRPGLSDLRDSGSIEEDASAVMFLFREAYYLRLAGRKDDHEEEMRRQAMLEATDNMLEIIVAKNRNGRTGTVAAFADMGANAIRNAGYERGRA